MARTRFLGRTSVRDALDSAAFGLEAAGVATPRLDAEFLLAVAMGVDRASVVAGGRDPIPREVVPVFMEWVKRRQRHEPVAYIVGVKPFRNIELEVDHRVLIPRDATETLVEAAVAELPRGAVVAEVGTGSGAIALALVDERPDLVVIATEVSPDALDVARANVARYSAARISLRLGDLLEPVSETVDAVIANLPYIPDGERSTLMDDVAKYEPDVALYGGPDGLWLARRLLADVPRVGARWIALEAGSTEQIVELRALVESAGFERAEIRAELGGAPRAVVGSRESPW